MNVERRGVGKWWDGNELGLMRWLGKCREAKRPVTESPGLVQIHANRRLGKLSPQQRGCCGGSSPSVRLEAVLSPVGLGVQTIDRKAGCVNSARPVWEGGEASPASPILIMATRDFAIRAAMSLPGIPPESLHFEEGERGGRGPIGCRSGVGCCANRRRDHEFAGPPGRSTGLPA